MEIKEDLLFKDLIYTIKLLDLLDCERMEDIKRIDLIKKTLCHMLYHLYFADKGDEK